MKIVHNILKEVHSNLEFYSIDELNEDRYKRFAELAIMFGYIRPLAEKHNWVETQGIQEFLISRMSSITSDRVFKNFYISYHLLLPYISIRDFCKIPHLESCLDIVLEEELISSEIPPHRQMEWDHMLYKLNRRNQLKPKNSSLLNKTIYTQYLNRDLAYALTHALFYCSDFGKETPNLSKKRLEELEFILSALIGKTYEERDVDLFLELSINYLSLRDVLDIDYRIIELIYGILKETSFIALHLSEEQTIQKYHSYFVFVILSIQLQDISMQSSTQITSVHRKLLEDLLSLESSELRTVKLNQNSFTDAWKVISSFRKKNFDFSKVRSYYKKWGYSSQLAKELERYIQHLHKRAERGILWEQESEQLQLSPKEVEKLHQELKNLLCKERRSLVKKSVTL